MIMPQRMLPSVKSSRYTQQDAVAPPAAERGFSSRITMRFVLYGEPPKAPPAAPPLIVAPVALMRLVEIDDIGELESDMDRLELGPEDFGAETKFNGWLVQAAGGRLWSRRGKELTAKFPDIAAAVAPYADAHLAGELVYWTPEGRMDEPTVTTVAGTKDPAEAVAKLRALPGRFEYVVFDALAIEGREIAPLPTAARREAILETIHPEGPLRISAIYPFSEWEGVYEQGVDVGGDGVVFKNLRAPYLWRPLGKPEPRPVGTWYKLKPVSTDDFVVYQLARGPKGRLLLVFGQFHEGRLVPIGQVDNLSSEDEAEAIERMKKEGPFVVELEFQGRFPEPPGALQHPRLLRFRPDKNPEDAVLPDRYAP